MSTRRRSVLTTAAVAAAVLVAACGGDDGSSPATDASDTSAADVTSSTVAASNTTAAPATTVAPSTTADLVDLATTYADWGPYPVGVTTLRLPTGNAVEVWYPAVDGTTGEVSYDVRDFTPPAIRDLLTADIPASFSHPGARDAAASSDGPFPVVLFSHGYTGIRLQSSFLTAHLASWGMVVAAPDHPSRDLPNVLSATASGERDEAIADLLGTLDLVVAESAGTGLLAGAVDDGSVVAVGHSAGGGTVVGAASDPRVDGYVSMASGVALAAADDTTTVPAAALPDRPSFFLAGSVDAVVPAETRTRPSFEAVPEPSLLWILEGVGHNGFDDFCTFGNGTGIIGIAEASGLGGLLDAQPQLRALGEDGCVPPAVPVADTFPAIRHAVTAWIRHLFGTDPAAVGLGPEVADSYPVAVEIVSKG